MERVKRVDWRKETNQGDRRWRLIVVVQQSMKDRGDQGKHHPMRFNLDA